MDSWETPSPGWSLLRGVERLTEKREDAGLDPKRGRPRHQSYSFLINGQRARLWRGKEAQALLQRVGTFAAAGARGGVHGTCNLQERLIPRPGQQPPCLSLPDWGKSQHEPSPCLLMGPLGKGWGLGWPS